MDIDWKNITLDFLDKLDFSAIPDPQLSNATNSTFQDRETSESRETTLSALEFDMDEIVEPSSFDPFKFERFVDETDPSVPLRCDASVVIVKIKESEYAKSMTIQDQKLHESLGIIQEILCDFQEQQQVQGIKQEVEDVQKYLGMIQEVKMDPELVQEVCADLEKAQSIEMQPAQVQEIKSEVDHIFDVYEDLQVVQEKSQVHQEQIHQVHENLAQILEAWEHNQEVEEEIPDIQQNLHSTYTESAPIQAVFEEQEPMVEALDETGFDPDDLIEEVHDEFDEFMVHQEQEVPINPIVTPWYCLTCTLDFPSEAYKTRHMTTKKHYRAVAMEMRGRKVSQKRKYKRKNPVNRQDLYAVNRGVAGRGDDQVVDGKVGFLEIVRYQDSARDFYESFGDLLE